MAFGYNFGRAGIAQLVEQLICNQKVAGSIPAAGTTPSPDFFDASWSPLLLSFLKFMRCSGLMLTEDYDNNLLNIEHNLILLSLT